MTFPTSFPSIDLYFVDLPVLDVPAVSPMPANAIPPRCTAAAKLPTPVRRYPCFHHCCLGRMLVVWYLSPSSSSSLRWFDEKTNKVVACPKREIVASATVVEAFESTILSLPGLSLSISIIFDISSDYICRVVVVIEDINAKQGRGFHGCFCRVEKKKRVFFSLLLLWVRKGIWLIVE